MRLDHDFVRILLARIKEVQWDGGYHDLYFEDRSDLMMSRYIKMLDEAGLIDAVDYSTHDYFCWRAKWITEEGERFLRAARNEKYWETAKKLIRKSHRKFTVEALKEALPRAKQQLRKRGR